MQLCGPLEFGRMNEEAYRIEDWKSLQCCRQNLLGHPGESVEDRKAEKIVGSGSLAHEVSEVKRTLLETRVEATSVTVLAKDLVTVCLCPENFSEAEFKNNGLSHVEEILRQHSV